MFCIVCVYVSTFRGKNLPKNLNGRVMLQSKCIIIRIIKLANNYLIVREKTWAFCWGRGRERFLDCFSISVSILCTKSSGVVWHSILSVIFRRLFNASSSCYAFYQNIHKYNFIKTASKPLGQSSAVRFYSDQLFCTISQTVSIRSENLVVDIHKKS